MNLTANRGNFDTYHIFVREVGGFPKRLQYHRYVADDHKIPVQEKEQGRPCKVLAIPEPLNFIGEGQGPIVVQNDFKKLSNENSGASDDRRKAHQRKRRQ